MFEFGGFVSGWVVSVRGFFRGGVCFWSVVWVFRHGW